ncbi:MULTISPECIES: hypothetical protein [unclassified Bradyrhizobium]|uniref:hypothetical protein n=1 Tax=unclassified Bradyrhizobium TaxID=2631580 RepID=UPI0023059760|nr:MULTISPECIES: hypothetical protein [unclassified Bradyrhizobium]MDA9412938.1 hypothetical protein [Bradyrhizobium sp. CCBAU 45384]MDA9438370.1 hypothetical protein [Bradyrhizobium sp. CCBAU 51745]
MFDRFSKFAGRKAVLATAAVLALTSVAPTASFAGGRHWHGGGGAAFAGAAIAGAIGTGLAIAATRDAYAYDPGPGYYYDSAPAYYSGPGYGPNHYYYGPGYAEQYGGYTKVCSHGWSGYACY